MGFVECCHARRDNLLDVRVEQGFGSAEIVIGFGLVGVGEEDSLELVQEIEGQHHLPQKLDRHHLDPQRGHLRRIGKLPPGLQRFQRLEEETILAV